MILLPVSAMEANSLLASIMVFLSKELNDELDRGLIYPLVEPFEPEGFKDYWLRKFACIKVKAHIKSLADFIQTYGEATEWRKIFLGTFYFEPNYPGRSSHICNSGFLTNHLVRN
ncbi:hypothetical protein NADFUDRAFT_81547 [Nadsonia fulvescens var. elongata DSM 6958]|uniref:Uncharacterized protein n=1 Tax=Nadsonia fulvescens var. elongata DSM 6958 TaxID=857566 RepID=A0A1E3PTB5_9ASCO|nr:hypothetical protein NADFUDRAFT_81547 [Nadsonia fulvescens var. elongata DSM 6958]